MTINQERTIEMIRKDAKKFTFIEAIILGGSLAKNTENENSDVDIFVVVSNDEFDKRKLTKNYFIGTIFDQKNYPAYIDGSIINKEFLEKIWTEGNECIKNTFSQVILLYSINKEIDVLIMTKKMTNYSKEENIKKFYALMKSYRFKADDDMNNIFQVKHGILQSVFFACRLVLTHNEIYYPCVKNIEKELLNCKNKPVNFIEKMNNVLSTFSFEEFNDFYEETEEYFKEYRFDDKLRKGYVTENEYYWFFGVRPYNEI